MFPFVAIEGQEKLKKALCLNLVNPKIGGVLISGEKGTAKTTLVRGLEEVVEGVRVINIPLNITEDNLIGSIDFEKTLKSGKMSMQTGVLEKARGNILYVDEINLLGENITNKILEELGHRNDFVLIGSMNPEEGELRPHFLDKFGLFVEVEGIKEVTTRVKIIKSRLEYEEDPAKFSKKYAEKTQILREQIERARAGVGKIRVSDQIIRLVIKVVQEAHTAGNRTEIIILETAKAIAALEERNYLNAEDIKEAIEYVLPHRIQETEPETRTSLEESQPKPREEDLQESRENQEESKESPQDESQDKSQEETQEEESQEETQEEREIPNTEEEIFDIGRVFKVKKLVGNHLFDSKKRKGFGKRCKTKISSKKGRYVKSIRPRGRVYDFAFDATLRAAAPYQYNNKHENLKIQIKEEHIRVKVREKRTGATILFVVDSSSSMGTKKRMKAVKGAILSLLKDAYEKRDKVGMVTFRKNSAEEILRITSSIDLANKRLRDIVTGGKTPLTEGMLKGYKVLKKHQKKDRESIPIMILISDGKANYSNKSVDPIEESLRVATSLGKENIKIIVVDSEEGFVKLGLAKNLAEKMNADYYRLEELETEDLVKVIKSKI